jgi:hypothetical protein
VVKTKAGVGIISQRCERAGENVRQNGFHAPFSARGNGPGMNFT